jgi:hypothetical protein
MNQEAKMKFFHRGHFPQGTVAVVKVHDNNPVEVTVRALFETGPKNWIIEVEPQAGDSCFETSDVGYNIEHVVAIIKRGEGPYRVQSHGTSPAFFQEDNYLGRCAMAKKGKHEYVLTNLRFVIASILKRDPKFAHLKEDHLVDYDAVVAGVNQSGIVKKVNDWGLCTVNKRKLHSLLVHLLARHKLKRGVEQKKQDEWDHQNYVRQMEDDLECA